MPEIAHGFGLNKAKIDDRLAEPSVARATSAGLPSSEQFWHNLVLQDNWQTQACPSLPAFSSSAWLREMAFKA
jgi:hypothetical protein